MFKNILLILPLLFSAGLAFANTEKPVALTDPWVKVGSDSWSTVYKKGRDRVTIGLKLTNKSVAYKIRKACPGSNRVEKMDWTAGARTAKMVNCRGVKRDSLLPPLIEGLVWQTLSPLPPKVEERLLADGPTK